MATNTSQSIPEMLVEQLSLTYHEVVEGIVQFAPKAIVALILVVVAWVVAKTISWVLRGALKRARFDDLMKRIGIDGALAQLGVREPLSSVLPRLLYYLLLLAFARILAGNLEIDSISKAMDSFFAYLPSAFSAAFVLVVGSAVGQFAGAAVATASEATGLDFGKTLGSMVSALVLFVAVVMALGQLKIDTDIIRIVLVCGLAGAALAFGLSFGLGSRDTVRNLLAGFYARKIFTAGDVIEFDDQKSSIHAISSTSTVLSNEEGRTVVANTSLTEGTVRIRN